MNLNFMRLNNKPKVNNISKKRNAISQILEILKNTDIPGESRFQKEAFKKHYAPEMTDQRVEQVFNELKILVKQTKRL